MKPRTYGEWQLNGYHVKKGETASGRNKKGQATFTIDQCEEDYDELEPCLDDYIYND